MNFIDRFKTFLEEGSLTQNYISEDSGLSKSYISMVLKGTRAPNKTLLTYLSKKSNRSINWWLYGSNEYKELSSLNHLIDFLISEGLISDDGNMDLETENLLIKMLKKEIKVKLNKLTQSL